MNPEIARALLSMGYRRRTKKGQEKGVWIKPVAHVCFVFHEDEMRWYNMFVDMTGTLSCWNSHEFKTYEYAGSYVQQLKGFEYDTRTDLVPGSKSAFEFISLVDELEHLSGL